MFLDYAFSPSHTLYNWRRLPSRALAGHAVVSGSARAGDV